MPDDLEIALEALEKGHVILGENHKSPLARDFLVKLLDSGKVKAVMMEAFQVRSLYKGTNEDLGNKTKNVSYANTQDDAATFPNSTKYKTIVELANTKDARVFGCDLSTRKVDDPERDKHMSRLFEEATKDFPNGIVMLVGSSHVPTISGLLQEDVSKSTFSFA